MVTKEEKELVLNFFDKNQILSECFLQLYEYQQISVNDVKLEFRDGLVGFKRDGERLRLYVIKDKNGVFRIKIKAATSHVFMPAEMINYQSDLDKNNVLFEKGDLALKPKTKVEEKKKNFSVKKSIDKNGAEKYKINNLNVEDIQPVIDCLNELKSKGIKYVKIGISEIK